MNIVLLSIGGLNDLSENAVYPDLLRRFRDEGHSVHVVCQRERRLGLDTEMNVEHGIKVLRVKTGNITKTNLVEKGISTILIGWQFKNAINKYFGDIKFDLVLYSTPPITIANTVSFIKKRDRATSYLMLKDIFPQNAIDIGLLKNTGWKSLIYKYFRKKEKQLYLMSDHIGCMSKANIEFILKHNPYLNKDNVEICPNTINPLVKKHVDKNQSRARFNLPKDKIIFVYGGNFGKPQNVDYIIEVLKDNELNNMIHFVMVGAGTDFYKIKDYKKQASDDYITVLNSLNKVEYDDLLDACDVGLIFLDYRFTIPNFPSRLLDYMNHEIPVLAATDTNTDVGQVITDGKFGWWCESKGTKIYKEIIAMIIREKDSLIKIGMNGRQYLEQNYRTEKAYKIIMSHFNIEEKR
ncbi:glycosyltransferase family 4 protein [Geosporobacter ferrireducens]|uniref:Glycosyltransferase WbuB n=1 Tax=Geosporobacter ferrireducens TaxID=1424294 RepID=A0A1D8GGW0_9FIRM|nr:glycosyltransferase family 4 protein [Geosporobacter ferrireducens]AOT70133.1 glycosyltransferase WbuB [Geosporobacter ferrireducens]